MKNSIYVLGALFWASMPFVGCHAHEVPQPTEQTASAGLEIRINQVGFYPLQEKVAVVSGGKVKTFDVIDEKTGKSVYSGQPSYSARTAWNKTERFVVDFSAVKNEGRYLLKVGTTKVPFEVRNRALSDLAAGALKSFYYQRSGMPIEKAYAGQWARPMGHPDTKVYIHASAATSQRPAESVISSPKGWYDAGDYNKYVVNSAYSIGLMLNAYQAQPTYFATQKVDIPESNNDVPDLLDEMFYNLDWLLTMQDPNDGGVYHKLTTPSFEGFVKPTDCHQKRYVVQKSVTAALDFATVMAQASHLYEPYQHVYPGFPEKALQAAKEAFEWAKQHPQQFYTQNENNKTYSPPVVTGEYGDRNARDEWFWASTELYLATGDANYLHEVQQVIPAEFQPSSWGNTNALGVFSWLLDKRQSTAEAAAIRKQLADKLIAYANTLIAGAERTAFHAPYGNEAADFFWGCLSEKCGNEGISLVMAYILTGNEAYRQNAHRNMDYLLGKNPTGYCYVTGFGRKSPMHPHHRLSASDGIEAPIPGLLVGGPNPGKQDGVHYHSTMPDESYEDVEASYASNEIAINWSASLVSLASLLEIVTK